MSFLRLGTISAIHDENDHLLLAKRGDLNIWTLPGGRLDSGEALFEAAKREVFEETGIHAHIERAVNLYYWAGWKRMNILFEGVAVGGSLKQRTDETRENAFQPIDFLRGKHNHIIAQNLQSDQRPYPRIIETDYWSQQSIRLKLAWRWLYNLLRGKPEPRHVRFKSYAVAIIRNRGSDRILTLPSDRVSKLPSVRCTGIDAPWRELQTYINRYTNQIMQFQWVGVHQIVQQNAIYFIFAANTEKNDIDASADWTMPQNAALSSAEADYLERVNSNFGQQSVWVITEVMEPSSDTLSADVLKSSS